MNDAAIPDTNEHIEKAMPATTMIDLRRPVLSEYRPIKYPEIAHVRDKAAPSMPT
jgi:hypothetical protein